MWYFLVLTGIHYHFYPPKHDPHDRVFASICWGLRFHTGRLEFYPGEVDYDIHDEPDEMNRAFSAARKIAAAKNLDEALQEFFDAALGIVREPFIFKWLRAAAEMWFWLTLVGIIILLWRF